MTRPSLLPLVLLAFLSLHQSSVSARSAALSSPPVAPVRPIVDEYSGIKVTDPYRYMEDLTDPEVKSWIKG